MKPCISAFLDSTHFSLLYEGGCLLNRYENDAAALAHFRSVCENACDEQDKLLRQIIKENSGTEFGTEHGFSEITGYDDFIKHVPVSTFSDYEKQIERIIKGERNILTKAPPVFYNISSGSTGEPKYFPICAEDITQQKLYFVDAPRGVIQEALPGYDTKDLFGCIFHMGDVFLTRMPDGIPNGVRSGAYAELAEMDGTFDCSCFSAPEAVLFPEKPQNMMYVKVRFALTNSNITAIHSVFVHRAIIIFEFILNNWDLLIDDIENGTVNSVFDVSEEWRDYIIKNLPPAPERAAFLRSLDRESLRKDMLKKIWPDIKYIMLITGDSFGYYHQELFRYIGSVPLHGFIYASSEAVMGLPPRLGVTDEYVLLPDTCLFEFSPEDEPDKLITMQELEIGRKYDIFITTVSGLYRYDLGDVVEVTGKYGGAPAVKICYRRNMILNLVDEKLNISQFENTMNDFRDRTGIKAEFYFITGNYETYPARYELFIETADELCDEYTAVLDECLRLNSINYAGMRDFHEISAPIITKLKPGTYAGYEEDCRKNGLRVEQYKPLRFVADNTKFTYFNQKKEKTFYGKEK